MARKKPYTKRKLIIDALLILITGGFWAFWIIFREVWQRI